MKYEVGQQFLVPSDDRTREIVFVHLSRSKPVKVTEVVLRCIDCVTIKKDLTIDVELMDKRIESRMYVLKTPTT